MTTKILIFKSMKKAYSIRTKNEKSAAGFEPASFSGPVPIQWFSNAIPTRPLVTLKGNNVKYTWTC